MTTVDPCAIETVQLQFVRPGSRHNQLLSPLTYYVALVGTRDPVDVHVPWQQHEFDQLLTTAQWVPSPGDDGHSAIAAQQSALSGLTTEVREWLRTIVPLQEELAAAQSRSDVVELRVVLHAAELARIPFELAYAPPGSRGAGRGAIVVTRQSRLGIDVRFDWPYYPKVLFAYALPPGQHWLAQRHEQLLTRALLPWLQHVSGDTAASSDNGKGDQWQRDALARHLVVLPAATAEDISTKIQEAAASDSGPYTYIHLLAHGTSENASALIELRDSQGRPDHVDSMRLAAVIVQPGCAKRPAAVFLATCYSGATPDVIQPAAALADAIHDAGIQLVIAAQFPLSFAGSQAVAVRIYEGLFGCEDPRQTLLAARQTAKIVGTTENYGALDWASLVAYCALPPGIAHNSAVSQMRGRRQQADSLLGRHDPLIIHGNSGYSRRTLREDHHNDRILDAKYTAYLRESSGGNSSQLEEWLWFSATRSHRWAATLARAEIAAIQSVGAHVLLPSVHVALRTCIERYQAIVEVNMAPDALGLQLVVQQELFWVQGSLEAVPPQDAHLIDAMLAKAAESTSSGQLRVDYLRTQLLLWAGGLAESLGGEIRFREWRKAVSSLPASKRAYVQFSVFRALDAVEVFCEVGGVGTKERALQLKDWLAEAGTAKQWDAVTHFGPDGRPAAI